LQEQKSKNPVYGKLLRRIRKQRGVSARQLAKEVGIDPSYVSKIETLRASPPAWGVMLAISRVLHSPKLLKASEQAFLRHSLFLTSSLLARLSEIPPTLVTELGSEKVASWKNNCSQMLGEIDSAYFSRVDTPVKQRTKR
jgi:transcriptional regulator with XRE-family HTH domain